MNEPIQSITSKGHTIRIVLCCLLFFAAIVDVGIGFYSVSKHNAHAASYWDRENMYDGPWMPLEFILLGAAVVIKKWDEPDEQ